MSKIEDSKLKLTYLDFEGFPDDRNRHEIINGDHFVTPSPYVSHQVVLGEISVKLHDHLVKHQLGSVLPTVAVVLSNVDIVVPDIVVILKENHSCIIRKYIEGAPNLIVEILSKSTAERDWGLKKALYERSGVPEYWIVDPYARIVEQHFLRRGGYSLEGEFADRMQSKTIPLVQIDLTRVWD